MVRGIYAEYVNRKIVIWESFTHRETIKQIKGRVYNPENKTWIIPFLEENITILKMLGCTFCKELFRKEKEFLVTSGGKDKTPLPIEPMPIKVKPYSHQIEAFNKACSKMKLFKVGETHG